VIVELLVIERGILRLLSVLFFVNFKDSGVFVGCANA
jgi:hypothetical protein